MQVVPEPLGIDPFRGQLALDPDAAVAGLFTEVTLAAGIVPVGLAGGFVGAQEARDLMQEDAGIDTHPHIAPEAAGPEAADPGDDQKLAGRGFGKGCVGLGKTGGAQEGG